MTRWKLELRRRSQSAETANQSRIKATVTDNPIEEELAAEWGERIAISKVIARGGKSGGYVPGAMERRT